MSAHHERWVLGVTFALLVSGGLWLVFHYFLPVQGEFGENRHPLEAWWLRLHGAAAMAFLVVLGTLLPIHIRRAWQLRRNHMTGIFVLSAVATLIVTGYGLYYAGGENLRLWVSVAHWSIGLAGTPAFILHMLLGKRNAAKLNPPQQTQWQRRPRHLEDAKNSSS